MFVLDLPAPFVMMLLSCQSEFDALFLCGWVSRSLGRSDGLCCRFRVRWVKAFAGLFRRRFRVRVRLCVVVSFVVRCFRVCVRLRVVVSFVVRCFRVCVRLCVVGELNG